MPCDVASRPRQRVDETLLYRVGDTVEHDWYGFGRSRSCHGGFRSGCPNHIDSFCYESLGKRRKAILPAFRRGIFECDSLAYDPAPFLEPCREEVQGGSLRPRTWTGIQQAERRHLRRSLRLSGERRRNGASQRSQQEAAAVHLSIT
jgi:hypothetical protein